MGGRRPGRRNVVKVVTRRSGSAYCRVFTEIEVDIFEDAQMVIKSEREFCVALCVIRIDAVSVVSSDVSDADEVFSKIPIRMMALNADKSGLAGFHSVDGEVVALVRAGDVVVEVAEKWERVVEPLLVDIFAFIENKSSSVLEKGQVDDRVVLFNFKVGANIGSEEPDNIVQVLVAESFKASPDESVIREAAIIN